jgi:glycosyltransferase involved in cell wall biosynthesis
LLYRIRGWIQLALLYKFILRRADHAFVQSEQMKRDLVDYGVSADKMTPVPMGVDLKTFDGFVRSPFVDPSRGPVIAYLGTLAGERRIDFLVRCLAFVLQQQPAAHLWLIGDGERPGDVDNIRREAERLRISDRVWISGFKPQKEALSLVAQATVCASPFFPTPILNSTSPTKLVEYMALGQPVVANDHPEQRLVLEQSGAGYCVPYDERAFAEAILRIIADPELAREMGIKGRRFVEQHRTYELLADRLEATYREIIRSRTKRR